MTAAAFAETQATGRTPSSDLPDTPNQSNATGRAGHPASGRGLGLVIGRDNCAFCQFVFGRLRDAGVPRSDCDISELWHRNRNGAYAMLAARLLCASPDLDRTALWWEVREAVRRETGGKPARTDQGAATVSLKLWRLGLVEGGRG